MQVKKKIDLWAMRLTGILLATEIGANHSVPHHGVVAGNSLLPTATPHATQHKTQGTDSLNIVIYTSICNWH